MRPVWCHEYANELVVYVGKGKNKGCSMQVFLEIKQQVVLYDDFSFGKFAILGVFYLL